MFKNRFEVTLFAGLVIAICIGLFISVQTEKKKALIGEANSIKFFQETNLKWKNSKQNPNFHYEQYDRVIEGSTPSKTYVIKQWWVSIFAHNNPDIGVIKISPNNFDLDLVELDCYTENIKCKVTMIFDHLSELAWEIEINNDPNIDLNYVRYNSPEQKDLSNDSITDKVYNSNHIKVIVERDGLPTINLNYLTKGIMNPNDIYTDFIFY